MRKFSSSSNTPDITGKQAGLVICTFYAGKFLCVSEKIQMTGKKINYSAIWPGTMAILAGIDLLGKFYAGDDSGRGNPQKGVGARFKSFTEKYLIQNKTDAETLYQLRNSLLHSFGLYSKTSKGEYRFILTRGSQQFITNTNEGQYVIDVSILWNKFEEGIESYFQELYQVHELQKKFELMFDNYGGARIG